MKWFPIICYLGIGLWQVAAHWDAIWPSNRIEREALHRCLAADHRFDPLDQAARDRCLKQVLAPQIRAQNAPTAASALPHLGG